MSDDNPLSALIQTGMNFKDKTDEECAKLVFDLIKDRDQVNGLRWYIAGVHDDCSCHDGDEFYFGISGTIDWDDDELIQYIEEEFHWDQLQEGKTGQTRRLIVFLSEVEKKLI